MPPPAATRAHTQRECELIELGSRMHCAPLVNGGAIKIGFPQPPSEASPISFDFWMRPSPASCVALPGSGSHLSLSLLLEAAMGAAMGAGPICGPKFFECLRYMRNMMRHVGTITDCRPPVPEGENPRNLRGFSGKQQSLPLFCDFIP